MSSILYYSNYCKNCQSLLQSIAQTSIKDDTHFICIDKRVKKPNGAVYVLLENGQELLLSPNVTKVPALLLLNRGHQVLFGEQIKDFINSQHVDIQKTATQNNDWCGWFSFIHCFLCLIKHGPYFTKLITS